MGGRRMQMLGRLRVDDEPQNVEQVSRMEQASLRLYVNSTGKIPELDRIK